MRRRIEKESVLARDAGSGGEFDQLLLGDAKGDVAAPRPIEGVVVGTLVGFSNNGDTPLVHTRAKLGPRRYRPARRKIYTARTSVMKS